uniref:Protein I'm not dead yet n=1 Tax=Trichogramma kaykai TaxID=54128 RepID=A0ABD2WG51_9HYME
MTDPEEIKMDQKQINGISVDVESDIKGIASTDKRTPRITARNVNFFELLGNFVMIYWKSIIIILWPIVLLPLLIYTDHTMYRCLYTVGVMAMYWVTEVLPLPVTGLIPIFLYPLLGVMSTSDTCKCYINDTTMMFVGSLVIAVAIEHSGVHMRVALIIIRIIGCSHRKYVFFSRQITHIQYFLFSRDFIHRLSLGLFVVTMFISMWISNTAATAMMLPIVKKVLTELETQGLGKMFEEEKDEEESEPKKKPTKLTMSYYMSAAYASSIGGIGTLVGSGTNLTMKGLYEARFSKGPGLNFAAWMVYAVPAMLVIGVLTWLWLQVLFMGLFRKNSKDAKAVNIGEEGERIAARVIDSKYKELGPVSWHEGSIAFLFILIVLLWFFRKPDFILGWPIFITNQEVKDSTAAIGLIILLFIIPSRLDFFRAFSSDPDRRPIKPAPALISWKIINEKMHWGLMFVLGGGFAIAAGSQNSGLSRMLGEALSGLKSMNPIWIMIIVFIFCETATELTSNVAVANIILPVLAEMCVAIKIHPLYLMVPATLGCSFSFHLPVGTPPNAIVSAAGKIPTKNLIIAGFGPSIITAIFTVGTFATWGVYSFGLHEFPSWATL